MTLIDDNNQVSVQKRLWWKSRWCKTVNKTIFLCLQALELAQLISWIKPVTHEKPLIKNQPGKKLKKSERNTNHSKI